MAYFTRVTGEKIESMAITPMAWSVVLFWSPLAKPRPLRTFISMENFRFLSSVAM